MTDGPGSDDAQADDRQSLSEFISERVELLIGRGLTEDEAFQEVIDAMARVAGEYAPHVLQRMARARGGLLLVEGRQREAFERRLRDVWGDAFDDCYEVEHSCLEAGEMFNERHRPAAAQDHDFRFDALVHIHSRGCLVSRELFTLLGSGFPVGAMALWRTLHELEVVAAVLGQAGLEVAERYLLHRTVEEAAYAQSWQQHHEALEAEPVSEETLAETQHLADLAIERFGERFGWPWEWARPLFPNQPVNDRIRFTQLQSLAGKEYMRPLVQQASSQIHAGSTGAQIASKVFRGQRMFIIGATNHGLGAPAQEALNSLVDLTETLLVVGRPGEEDANLPLLTATLRLLLQKAERSLRRTDAFVLKLEEEANSAIERGHLAYLWFRTRRRLGRLKRHARTFVRHRWSYLRDFRDRRAWLRERPSPPGS